MKIPVITPENLEDYTEDYILIVSADFFYEEIIWRDTVMCAITGMITKNKIQYVLADEFFGMCRMQRHRGPDDEGIVAFDLNSCRIREVSAGETVGCKGLLGFERLSIQDLSHQGHQPMQSADSDISIVFNGEVYNFLELRDSLVKKGHIFKSGTDTEVILHMYMEYGIEKTLEELNGMFAFAIADMRTKKLYIVRDRFGIKPLYVAYTEDALLFASEMKAFLGYHNFAPRLNLHAVEEYTLFKSLMSATLLEGVEQLGTGTVMEYNLETNDIRQWKYFDLESYHRRDVECSYADFKERIWETMRTVVRRQVISDAKVGCQLSGGIDSSILSKVASEEHEIMDTVSCKADCEEQADAPYIDMVNENLVLNAHIRKMNSRFFIEHIIDAVWHFDSVLSHTPAVGMFQISECAYDNSIKVLLSGEGADEIFGGYKCFKKLAFLQTVPSESDIVDAVIFRDGKEDIQFLRKVIPTIEPERYYQERIACLNRFTGTVFDRQIKYEMSTQLVELLTRQDKMSMAHSVENRVPYLDNEMVRLAWDIPEIFLLDRTSKEGKYILKDIASGIFGNEFAFRRKVGFFIPGNMFLCSDMNFVRRVLACIRKRGVVCGDIFEKWAKNELHVYGGLNSFQSALFFKMFTLEIWCQLFLDKRSVSECKKMLQDGA